MTPKRILLNLHLVTRIRMDRVKLPMGSSRTKWINDAIREKLDRDNPETIGPAPMEGAKPVQPVQPVQPMEDDDFWGETEKVRELLKRHTR